MTTEAQIELISCPSCGVKGPQTKYCLSCGNEKLPKSEDNIPDNVAVVEEISKELVENLDKMEEISEKKSEKKIQEPKQTRRTSAKKTNSFVELDPIVKDNISNLKMTIDLILWLIDLFLKGNVEDENFNSLFDSYEYRLNQGLKRREQILESARDLEPLQKSLNRAMLQLSELEQKKIIGDISDEEYEMKVPVFRWDINKFERQIAKSKSEISVLEDLAQIITDEEISEMTSTAKNSKEAIDELQKSGKVNQETAARIKKAMDSILTAYKNNSKK